MKFSPDTLEIGQLFYEMLNPIAPTFPIVVEQGCPMPYITYRRTALRQPTTKDAYAYEESATVELYIVASTYAEAINLAQQVKIKLETLRGKWRDIFVDGIRLVNADEEWAADAYVQRMWWDVTVLNNK